MSDTPETDAKVSAHIGFYSCATVPAELCRRMERERDKARKHLRDANRGAEINAHINQKYAQQIIDARDENAKLRDIAERAVKLLTNPPALSVFPNLAIHNKEHGKQFRAELEQLNKEAK